MKRRGKRPTPRFVMKFSLSPPSPTKENLPDCVTESFENDVVITCWDIILLQYQCGTNIVKKRQRTCWDEISTQHFQVRVNSASCKHVQNHSICFRFFTVNHNSDARFENVECKDERLGFIVNPNGAITFLSKQ